MEKLALSIQGTPIPVPSGIPTGLTLGGIATGFIQVLMVLGIFVSLLYIVYGGFFWLQSKGDKERLDKARRIIVYAIVGLIIMALSLVIVNLIASAVGVNTVVGDAT